MNVMSVTASISSGTAPFKGAAMRHPTIGTDPAATDQLPIVAAEGATNIAQAEVNGIRLKPGYKTGVGETSIYDWFELRWLDDGCKSCEYNRKRESP